MLQSAAVCLQRNTVPCSLLQCDTGAAVSVRELASKAIMMMISLFESPLFLLFHLTQNSQ